MVYFYFAALCVLVIIVRYGKAASGVYWLACWPLVPKFAGSNPAKVVGFFGRKNPQHAFLRRGSKSQLCGMLKNPTITV
jgi:hypothetical protein